MRERWVGAAVRRSCAQVSRAARCAKYGVEFVVIGRVQMISSRD